MDLLSYLKQSNSFKFKEVHHKKKISEQKEDNNEGRRFDLKISGLLYNYALHSF
jgi:hypothetical protein